MKKKNREINREAEIKLELDAVVYEQFKSIFLDKKKEQKQENYFFDNPDGFLLESKWVLRVRTQADQGFITVKGPGKIIGALHCRTEYETPISREKADDLIKGFFLQSEDLLPCRELIKRFGDMYVTPFLSFKNIRITSPWKEWKFELDKTTIKGSVFYELEVETDMAKKQILEQELKALFKIHGWNYIPSLVSKFRRALTVFNYTKPFPSHE